MVKFGFLRSIQMALAVGGWLIIVFGFLGALTLSTSYGQRGFSFPIFLSLAVVILINGGLIIALAEVIGVFLNMEDHLDRMVRHMEQLSRAIISVQAHSTASRSDTITPTSGHSDSQAKRQAIDPMLQPLPAPVNGPQLSGRVVVERIMLKEAPNRGGIAVAMPQHAIIVVGRSADGGWLQVYKNGEGPYWAQESGLDVTGDIAGLPSPSGIR